MLFITDFTAILKSFLSAKKILIDALILLLINLITDKTFSLCFRAKASKDPRKVINKNLFIASNGPTFGALSPPPDFLEVSF